MRKNKPYDCDICSKMFSEKTKHKRYRATLHEGKFNNCEKDEKYF